MKPGKALLIITIVIVVLVLIAFAINQSNKKKTTTAVANQTTPNPNVTGRYIAVSSNGTDYTEVFNGKPVWLWVGRGPAQSDYIKMTSGANSGWSILNEYLQSGLSKMTCITRANSPGHPCIAWKDEKGNTLEKA